jgi:hypothetical protein
MIPPLPPEPWVVVVVPPPLVLGVVVDVEPPWLVEVEPPWLVEVVPPGPTPGAPTPLPPVFAPPAATVVSPDPQAGWTAATAVVKPTAKSRRVRSTVVRMSPPLSIRGPDRAAASHQTTSSWHPGGHFSPALSMSGHFWFGPASASGRQNAESLVVDEVLPPPPAVPPVVPELVLPWHPSQVAEKVAAATTATENVIGKRSWAGRLMSEEATTSGAVPAR